jgi:uncharacterized protein (TIGR02594 family)
MRAYRTTSDLNCRAAPATGKVLHVIPRHELVDGALAEGGWVAVSPAGGQRPGFVAARFLEELPAGEPRWMQWMRAKLGEREIPGPGDNAWVLDCFRFTQFPTPSDDDAWCSASACWAMEHSGHRSPRSAAARDWSHWGVRLADPRPGCVVVLDRHSVTNPRAAHVAFLVRREGSRLVLLGGNQGNSVSVASYAAVRALDYRWPIGAPLPS